MSLGKYLFRFSKSKTGATVVGLVFEKLNKLLPVKKIYENEYVLAFWHPRPYWEKHVLIVPKKAIGGLSEVNTENSVFVQKIFESIPEIIIKLGWKEDGYSIVSNGGERQEVAQLHFHLYSGKIISKEK